MAGIIPNLPGIMVGVGQNFPMSACEPTVECQLDVRKIGRQKYRQTDGLTERQIQDRKTFQLSYQNKSCSECQRDVRKIET